MSKLVIPNVLPRHGATYAAKATNIGGEAKVLANLIVRPPTPPPPVLDALEPPVFVETFGNVTVEEGNQLILECRIKGNPTPKVNRSTALNFSRTTIQSLY